MQVTNINDVKIYNLSSGKSIPEWLSDRKKRKLQKSDVDIRRRIELIQDFEMPIVSNNIRISPDSQYIVATGIYKPRARIYDVRNLSMKCERCFDAEVVQFDFLADDYLKMVFLQCDRFVEFHAAPGKYYRIRIPRFGRDLAYDATSCDLYIVGDGRDVYRLNLDQGRFLNPYTTDSSSLNVSRVFPTHQLFVCGTSEGRIEAWDPRVRKRVGILDCASSLISQSPHIHQIPSITSITCRDALTMAVGTSTGQVLIHDLRSDQPLIVKDHMYGFPIKGIKFEPNLDLVVSMDTKIIKLWERETGKAYTSIEPGVDLNEFALYPNSGMIFATNEARKMLTYYIPSVGPAPRWCSFLDTLTEELEENMKDTVYDDYKFVTLKELEGLGLSHLIGSSLLKAYMHGYFMDVRLYNKAKSLVEPFAYEEYRKKLVREKIEAERRNRVKPDKKLPSVNKELAQKLLETEQLPSKRNQQSSASTLLSDDRFSAMFNNPDFQVDTECEEYQLLHPVVSKVDRQRRKRIEKEREKGEEDEEEEGQKSEDSSSSSDDEHQWTQEVKQRYRDKMREEKRKKKEEDNEVVLTPKYYEVKEGEGAKKEKKNRATLGERLAESSTSEVRNVGSIGNLEMTFSLKKPKDDKSQQKSRAHHEERRKIRRSAHTLPTKKNKPKFWMGKRVQ